MHYGKSFFERQFEFYCWKFIFQFQDQKFKLSVSKVHKMKSSTGTDPDKGTSIFLKIDLKGENKTVELSVNPKREARLKHQNDILLLKYYIQLFRTHNPEYLESRPVTNDSMAVLGTTPVDSMTSHEIEQNFYISEFNTYGRKKNTQKHFKNQSESPLPEFYDYDNPQGVQKNSSSKNMHTFDHNTTEFMNPTPIATDRGCWGYLVLPGPNPMKLEIERAGIEAWLKNIEDYDV